MHNSSHAAANAGLVAYLAERRDKSRRQYEQRQGLVQQVNEAISGYRQVQEQRVFQGYDILTVASMSGRISNIAGRTNLGTKDTELLEFVSQARECADRLSKMGRPAAPADRVDGSSARVKDSGSSFFTSSAHTDPRYDGDDAPSRPFPDNLPRRIC